MIHIAEASGYARTSSRLVVPHHVPLLDESRVSLPLRELLCTQIMFISACRSVVVLTSINRLEQVRACDAIIDFCTMRSSTFVLGGSTFCSACHNVLHLIIPWLTDSVKIASVQVWSTNLLTCCCGCLSVGFGVQAWLR